jgi:haloalkane dehalogenase
MKEIISAEFSYKSNYIHVLDGVIHYIEEPTQRTGQPVFVFIHGNPTSSYLWRNIIPYVTPLGRTIAMDLIGFGKSSKPDIEYTFKDHIHYINVFIQKLDLQNIILVLHDWGGPIGINYARHHSENIKGIVFMETFCKPMDGNKFDVLTKWVFKLLRKPGAAEKWVGKHNVFVRFILPMSIIRKLSRKEKEYYAAPFSTMKSRKPIVEFPKELPFSGENAFNEKVISDNFEWFKKSNIPKLLLYAKPGALIKSSDIVSLESELNNLTTVYIGKGKHYIQEDQPQNIGEAIEQWCLMIY